MARARSATEFTARWLERLKPPESGRVEYFDDHVHGLGIRVSATGNKSWFVMYRVKGDPRVKRVTLEPYPQMSLADARERAHAIVFAASQGDDPAGEKREERTAPTFGKVAAEYIERHAKANKRTWRKDEGAIKKDLLPEWEHRKAKDIRRRDVIAVLDRIKERGSPIQANRTLALARKIFNWAISRDLVEMNPCTQIGRVVAENQRDRVLSEDEIRRFWRACEALHPTVCAAFRIRLLTAQRGGEVDRMRWSDLDLENGWWTIPGEHAKNKLSHRVPITAPAKGILEAQREAHDDAVWVFPSPRRTGMHLTNPQHSLIRLREKLGIDDLMLHDLRRTSASHMTGIGISRLVVSKILNHVEQGVTRVYDRHSYDSEKRNALTRWAMQVQRILTEKRSVEGERVAR